MIKRFLTTSSRLFYCDHSNYYTMYKDTYTEHAKKFSHIDENGKAKMVDVGDKNVTERTAKAKASVFVGNEVFELIKANNIKKGNVISVAEIAGIMGAKKTSDLIPLCHPLALTKVNVQCSLEKYESKVEVLCEVKCISRTGVEMEALTGASIAALTIYDMCKAVNKSINISDVHLIQKTGGKSGTYKSM